MAKYNTLQKEELRCFLARHKTESFTVRQIADRMKADPEVTKAPGESTVYRLVKELVESGEVKRTVKGNSRNFVYQLTEGEGCHHHLHMKCVACGKLYHMNDEESREIVEKIFKEESFELDQSAVLPGKCRECKGS
ncbi:transcriptional repressor [Ruminococcus sp. NK3A76]|uniref:Fur family transcriptional regulator n=1 Tax=Ruminococcus sp. NK3A76 TaxID=877411 RepID=UPI00048B6ABA|nr:transcriptional repressor [Ruminococcus sp. NK3A76]